MERTRTTWIDERLDDFSRSVDNVHEDLRSINARMDEGFRGVNGRIDAQGAALGVRLDGLQRMMMLTLLTMAATLLGVAATLAGVLVG